MVLFVTSYLFSRSSIHRHIDMRKSDKRHRFHSDYYFELSNDKRCIHTQSFPENVT